MVPLWAMVLVISLSVIRWIGKAWLTREARTAGAIFARVWLLIAYVSFLLYPIDIEVRSVAVRWGLFLLFMDELTNWSLPSIARLISRITTLVRGVH